MTRISRGGGPFRSGQAGYTLIEVIITSALSVIVLSALTSVVLTTAHAGGSAIARIQASAEIRDFQLRAYDDIARSAVPAAAGCGTAANQCTTTPLKLTGLQASNNAAPSVSTYQVSYSWDGAAFLDRQVSGGTPHHLGTDVTGFSWYVDGSPPGQTVVVTVTVTIRGYQQSQTFRFYPRLNP